MFVTNRDATIPIEVKKEIWVTIPEGIKKLEDDLAEEIRDYLLNLRLKE